MTIEEIKKEIEFKWKNTEDEIDYDTETGYSFSKIHAYKECLNLMEQYSPWRPYPKEKPSKAGLYLVTMRDEAPSVELCYYSVGGFGISEFLVTAWMEFPKSYRRGYDT